MQPRLIYQRLHGLLNLGTKGKSLLIQLQILYHYICLKNDIKAHFHVVPGHYAHLDSLTKEPLAFGRW